MGTAGSGRRAEGGGLSTPPPHPSPTRGEGAGGRPGEPVGLCRAPWINFYGRRKGKTLRRGQQRLVATRLAELAPPDADAATHPMDLAALFPQARAVWLEIGFGGGEHMIAQAAANPDIGILGAEAYLNGVAMLLAAIERAGTANIRIHADDARFLLDRLPPASIGRAFLLYPDPWPKRRHAGRRFVQPGTRDQLARVLAPGADLRIATDIADYVAHTVAQFAGDGRFAQADAPRSQPWPDWPGTRYEAKALREGRTPHYLTYSRR